MKDFKLLIIVGGNNEKGQAKEKDMGEKPIGEKQELPTMLNDLIKLESSSRQRKKTRTNEVDEDMPPSIFEGRFNIMEGRFDAIELSWKAMNIVINDIKG